MPLILWCINRHGRSNSSLPEGALLGTPEQQHLASLPLTHFSVRMNSLEYIQDHLPAFSEIIAKRCAAKAQFMSNFH